MKIYSTLRVLRFVIPVVLVCFLSALSTSVSYGQTDDSVETIKAEQERLAERYKQLEAKLFSLHEFEKDSNPSRSKLLQKAFLQSQEKMTNVQLNRAVKLITDGKFKDAEKMQARVHSSVNYRANGHLFWRDLAAPVKQSYRRIRFACTFPLCF